MELDAQLLDTAAFGSTGARIPRVGLGSWAFGGEGWGGQDDADSIATVRRAIELGVDWIDTAAVYGLGRSEDVVRRALELIPAAERPLVFTKCGLVWDPNAEGVRRVLAPESIRRECEASLGRLGVEVIDLYQLHWPSADGTPVEESWAAMAALVEEGKVRWAGVSNFDLALLKRCEAIRHVDCLQPPLSLLVREATAELLPWCAANGTGVIVYSPLHAGLLSGRFSAQRAAGLPATDWRRGHPSFSQPEVGRALALVEALRPIAARLGTTVGALAIAWTLAWPAVSGAIVGGRRPEQLGDWIGAGALRLGGRELDEIAKAIEAAGAGAGPLRPAGSA